MEHPAERAGGGDGRTVCAWDGVDGLKFRGVDVRIGRDGSHFPLGEWSRAGEQVGLWIWLWRKSRRQLLRAARVEYGFSGTVPRQQVYLARLLHARAADAWLFRLRSRVMPQLEHRYH